MLANNPPTFMLASSEPALLTAVEPALLASGARVEIVLSAEAAMVSMAASVLPTLALIDVNLSGLDQGLDAFLTDVRTNVSSRRLPIVVISDTVTQEWTDRLAEGVIDDLILRPAETPYWRLRLDMVLRALHKTRELESIREAAVLNAQTDHLTGVYNRETILSMLFRETDRVQRMKSSLCMILFDIDDFGHWNSRLGADACDDLLCQVVSRTNRLLRSYDLLGRPGMDEFLAVLPGCTGINAVMLCERLRLDVFSPPFRIGGDSIRLSACFGIATSQGRSPVVVLREAEQALVIAKAAGPESIQCFSGFPDASAAPVTYLSPSTGNELLAW
jgi:two-component system cell cycle response regulator